MKLEKVFVVSHHYPDGVNLSVFKKKKFVVAYLKEFAKEHDFELDNDSNPIEAYSDEGDFVAIRECDIE